MMRLCLCAQLSSRSQILKSDSAIHALFYIRQEVKKDDSDDSVMCVSWAWACVQLMMSSYRLIDDEDTKAKVRDASPTKR